MPPSPFEGLPEEQIHELQTEFAKHTSERFSESIGALQEAISKIDPIYLVPCLTYYNLNVFINEERSSLTGRGQLDQHHVELVQAMALQSSDAEAWETPRPDAIQDIHDLAEEVCILFAHKNFLTSAIKPDARFSEALAQNLIRTHTQSIRNWSNSERMRSEVKSLLAPLDDRIAEASGLSPLALMDMLFALVKVIEERQWRHTKKIAEVAGTKSVDKFLQLWLQNFPPENPERNRREMEQLFKERKATIHQIRPLIVHYGELFLPEVYTFSRKEILQAYPGPSSHDVPALLTEFYSLVPGELAGKNPEHFFLDNPVWSRPFIQVNHDELMCPIPGLLVSQMLKLCEQLFEGRDGLKRAYLERKSKWLEDRMEQVLRAGLPESEVLKGVEWQDPASGQKGETDVVVVWEDVVLIAEAKSGQVTDPARRGAPEQLKKRTSRLVDEAAQQSGRFAEFLSRQSLPLKMVDRSGKSATLRAGPRGLTIIRVNITWEFFAMANLSWRLLADAGLVKADTTPAPTMTISDLDTVFEFLQGPLQKLHYLFRRQQLEGSALIKGDEIDKLALYLDNGFGIGDAEHDGTVILLDGMSEPLDYYMMVAERGPAPERPCRRLTRFWADVIDDIQCRRSPGAFARGRQLLSVEYRDQEEFERRLAKIMKYVSRAPDAELNVISLHQGSKVARSAVVGYVYSGLAREERNARVQSIVREQMQIDGIKEVVLLGFDAQNRRYPFNIAASFP